MRPIYSVAKEPESRISGSFFNRLFLFKPGRSVGSGRRDKNSPADLKSQGAPMAEKKFPILFSILAAATGCLVFTPERAHCEPAHSNSEGTAVGGDKSTSPIVPPVKRAAPKTPSLNATLPRGFEREKKSGARSRKPR